MAIDKLKCNLQYMLPHHFLSRIIAKLANCKVTFVKNTLIKLFIHFYKIDLSIASLTKLSEYPCFNDFFTRALNENARPIIKDKEAMISPADGVVSQAGRIKEGKLLQAKGHSYKLDELLGCNEEENTTYLDGTFMTIYLAPHDYHRVHMPIDGRLISTKYVPGKLFSVNTHSASHIPNLFCRNERLISSFDTEIGEIALIMVGAMLVAGIETVWGERETPCQRREILVKHYEDKQIVLSKGSEMGRFLFGSTVILLFPRNTIELSDFKEQQVITMGSYIGRKIKADT